MKRDSRFVLVLVTAPDLKIGRSLARSVLEAKLAACVNLVPKLESHYWWQGKLEVSAEVLLLIKTVRPALARLEKTVVASHPYDTPEFVVVPLEGGSARYLQWLADSTRH